jgi:hydroxymethylpyrimidine pyrophosphatase-like HAD family hydrolase
MPHAVQVEMLQLCGLGVAMANAVAPALDAADALTEANSNDGVARAVERFVLQPRGLL